MIELAGALAPVLNESSPAGTSEPASVALDVPSSGIAFAPSLNLALGDLDTPSDTIEDEAPDEGTESPLLLAGAIDLLLTVSWRAPMDGRGSGPAASEAETELAIVVSRDDRSAAPSEPQTRAPAHLDRPPLEAKSDRASGELEPRVPADAPVVEGDHAAMEVLLAETRLVASPSQGSVLANSRMEPPRGEPTAARLETVDFDAAVTSLDADHAEVIVGEGSDRLRLEIQTGKEGIRVWAAVPSQAIGELLIRHQDVLRSALSAQGLELVELETQTTGDPSAGHSNQEEREWPADEDRASSSRRPVWLQRRRIVA